VLGYRALALLLRHGVGMQSLGYIDWRLADGGIRNALLNLFNDVDFVAWPT
jgi:hypothetical protein